MNIKIKKLIIIPLLLLSASVLILFNNYRTTGDFILKDIDLRGGTLITIESDKAIDANLIEDELIKKHKSVIVSSLKTMTGYGAGIEVEADANTTEVISDIKALGVDVVSYSVESVGPTLGATFWKQVVYVLIVAFVLMGMTIFIIYKHFVPSITIILAALSNIITALAFTSLIGIKVSFAGFAGMLMLIGYSVDTNILLTTKVLKSETREFDKIFRRALITGITLNFCIIATMLIVLLFSESRLLKNIASILVAGFLADLAYTWVFNSSILESWVKRMWV